MGVDIKAGKYDITGVNEMQHTRRMGHGEGSRNMSMQKRVEMYSDGVEVRLVAVNSEALLATLFRLIYRGTVEAGDIGITMNTAVIGASDKYEGDPEDLAMAIEETLHCEGYTVA